MKENKKTIYVLLTDTGTFLARAIKWFTGAPYSHVSIVFDEKLDEIYSFGRKRPRNPLIAGFIKEDVYFGTYRYFRNTHCLLLKLDVTENEYHKIRDKIRAFENNKDLFSYNLIGLLGVLFSYPIALNNAYFCSQFVAEVFKESGVDLWGPLHSALVTPNDFLLHPRFEYVYEGKLYDYPLLDEEILSNTIVGHTLYDIKPIAFLKKILL